MPPRGIAQSDWDGAKREARSAMIATARGLAGTISYGDLTRRITSLEFDPDQTAFHDLLCEIACPSRKSYPGVPMMQSR